VTKEGVGMVRELGATTRKDNMRNLRILSVDDEKNFTELLKQYFEPRGYDVDVSFDGDSALELLTRKKYDVVLLDLKMVGINGDELMRRSKELYPDMGFIFITAYCDSGKTKERLMKEGVYAYVEKPIASLKHLENLVNQAAGVNV